MKAIDYLSEWSDKKYVDGKELSVWTIEEVVEFVKSYDLDVEKLQSDIQPDELTFGQFTLFHDDNSIDTVAKISEELSTFGLMIVYIDGGDGHETYHIISKKTEDE